MALEEGRAGSGANELSADRAERAHRNETTRSHEETLEYIEQLIQDLRGLAQRCGTERLATLLALAQYEVKGLRGAGGANRQPRP